MSRKSWGAGVPGEEDFAGGGWSRIKARRREGARCSIQGELSAAGAGRDAG